MKNKYNLNLYLAFAQRPMHLAQPRGGQSAHSVQAGSRFYRKSAKYDLGLSCELEEIIIGLALGDLHY
jgi:hypothetical protein